MDVTKQAKQPGGTEIAIYRITLKRPGILTKRFDLQDGNLRKTSIAQVSDGTGDLLKVADLSAFSDLFESLPPNAALTYGIAPGHPAARLVSQAKAKPNDPQTITRPRRYFQLAPLPGILMLDSDPPKPLRSGSEKAHPNPPN